MDFVSERKIEQEIDLYGKTQKNILSCNKTIILNH